MMYSNKLRHLGLSRWGELRNITAVIHCLNGDYSEDRANPIPEVPTERRVRGCNKENSD